MFPSPCGVWVVSCKHPDCINDEMEFPSPCGVWVVSGGGSRMNWMSRFPSPCGVWVVSIWLAILKQRSTKFPSPCGVWVVSRGGGVMTVYIAGFRPLAGCVLFRQRKTSCRQQGSFRPLVGCGLFLLAAAICISLVGFRPLAGCGLFRALRRSFVANRVSVPLRGVGCFLPSARLSPPSWFPSPCGVWVVSAISDARPASIQSFRPLAGCGLFLIWA